MTEYNPGNWPPFPPGDWLPSHEETLKWLKELLEEAECNPKPFDRVITDFKALVDEDPALKILSEKMFQEIPIVEGDVTYEAKSFDDALKLCNEILTLAPKVRTSGAGISSITVPFNAVFNWPAATTSGYVFFLNKHVNGKLKNIINKWGEFLKTQESTTYLASNIPPGDKERKKYWFSEEYQKRMKEYAQWTGDINALYKCDPKSKTWGFNSWDCFFTRTFCDGVRGLSKGDRDDPKLIVNPCEAGFQAKREKVHDRATFWLKDQPYSILDMLNFDSYSYRFFNGTVYQGWLSSACYHRWHAPISGTVKRVVQVPGTYYSNVRSNLYPRPDPSGPNLSQFYLASVATRALIFIEADNADIGLICFIAIGMNEISSCEIISQEHQHVDKGDLLGMFHMGGSAFCLVFEPRVKLEFRPEPKETPDNPHKMFKLKSPLATVKN
jgi:phosphatidylserine decarboxylase